jgi:hypothetical protein
MPDLPHFILASVAELCPAGACIQRINKVRFKIRSRNAAALSLLTNRQVLELILSESLVKMYQSALANNDDAALTDFAHQLREQLGHKLQVIQTASPNATADLICLS